MNTWLKENVWYLLGAGVTSLFIFLMCIAFLGDTFFGLYTSLGFNRFMENPKGVFADCRRPENRGNKFCDPTMRERESPSWKEVKGSNKGGPAFSLN